jgi:valyl-tRNA synthetase
VERFPVYHDESGRYRSFLRRCRQPLAAPDRWILHTVNQLAREVTENMDKYELGIAVQKVYDFIWEEFCDWYIEMAKPRLYRRRRGRKADRCSGR